MRLDAWLLGASALASWAASSLSQEPRLHTARFARLHELQGLLSPGLRDAGLLLGRGPLNHVLRVRPRPGRPELGNMLVVAPTRGGKGLLAVSQLLTWPASAIVNDIKGELFAQTAGYRSTLGPVYVLDPTGVGHQYDPLWGRQSERELYASAKSLLFEPHEGDGTIFTQRATKMLSLLFLAARLENQAVGREVHHLLPYVGQMLALGLKPAATRLQRISPALATQFLAGELGQTDFEENKFLLSAWETLDARLFPLLTADILRCFAGSHFNASALMRAHRPVTLYLRWPEAELLALSPLVRLVWESLIRELITTFDAADGHRCHPVLLLLDEAGVTGIPNLHQSAATVAGRGICLWLAVQSLSQLDAAYGRARADTLRNNMETQLYYRQASLETAKYLEERLGRRSEFARSQTTHAGERVSQGQSEQAVPLLSAQAITQLGDAEIIGFHRNLPPFRARRMDWRAFPLLRQRRSIPPPSLAALPALEESPLTAGEQPGAPSAAAWQLSPALTRRARPAPALDGFKEEQA
jgi:type IV secretion system protein VirD4